MSRNLKDYVNGTLLYHEGSYNFMRQFVGLPEDRNNRIDRNNHWLESDRKQNPALFQKVSEFALTSKALIECEDRPYFTWQNLAIFVSCLALSFFAALKFYPQRSEELAHRVLFIAIALNAGVDLSSRSRESIAIKIAAAVKEFMANLPPGSHININTPNPLPDILANAFTLLENDISRREKVTILLTFAGASICTAVTVFMRIRAHDNLLAKLKSQAEELRNA